MRPAPLASSPSPGRAPGRAAGRAAGGPTQPSLRSLPSPPRGRPAAGRQPQSSAALPTLAGAASSAGLLALAAAPFLLVQGLADSEAGQRLAADLAARKPALEKAAAAAAAAEAAEAAVSPLYGPARFTWPWPGGPAPHLPGTAPGDAGWDPLRLCADEDGRLDGAAFARLADLEVLHARWAMLAALGAVAPEAAALCLGLPLAEPRWWAVGYAKLTGGVDIDYLGVAGLHVAGGQGVAAIAASQALLMSGPELARAAGPAGLEPLGIFLPGPQSYPGGGLFDPLGLASGSTRGGAAAARLKVAELKHGRLAMVAWVGLAAQAGVGRRGPLADLVGWVGGGEVGRVGV